MIRRTKPFNSPLPNRSGGQAGTQNPDERGVAFLILMMVLTILLISMTVALPDIYTQGQREREEELIFRGNEYARAIMLYHRQFNRFPTSVKDLMKKTNGYRFLRHAYPDPMTRSGKWRFIHANAAGVVIDSKTLAPPSRKPGEKSSGSDQQGTAQVAAPGGKTDQSSSSGSSSDQELKGAFIVGVASTSTHKSIRVLNNHDRYDEWEFLGIGTAAEGPGNVQPGSPGPGGQAKPQSSGMGMGAPNPSNPKP